MRIAHLLLVSSVSISAPLAAQVVTGSIEGMVLASSGGGVREAEVQATGPALPGMRTSRTDDAGRFLLPLLPAGTYRVTVRAIGFRPVTYEGVPVGLASTVRLPNTLMETTTLVLRAIVIQASAVSLDVRSTAVRTTFTADVLDALPVSRDFSSVAGLGLGASDSYYGDGVNFLGATGMENTWYVDGINVTSTITGGPGMRLPSHLLQQVEIRTGVYEASLGQGLGAAVNTVTPSGGNTLRFSAFGFVAGDALAAEPREGSGTVTGFSDVDISVSVGGPVRRDRAWFYLAYNPALTSQTVAIPGVPPQHARGIVHSFAGKLTWRPTGALDLDLTVLGDPGRLDAVEPVTGLFGYPDSLAAPDPVLTAVTSGGVNIALRGAYRVSPRVLVEAYGQRYANLDERGARTTLGQSAPTYQDLTSGISVWSGGTGMTQRLNGTRWSLGIQAQLALPRHLVRTGMEFEETTGEVSFEGADSQSGGFIFASSPVDYYWFDFLQAGKLRNRAPSLILQDAWQLHPRLLLNAGLRWEQQRIATGDTTRVQIGNGLQPRLGLIWQSGGANLYRAYASYGRFVERTVLWMATLFEPGYIRGRAYDHDPRSDALVPAPTSVIVPNADVHAQAVREVSIGLERTVGSGMAIGARVVGRDLENAIEDSYPPNAAATLGNPGRGTLTAFPRARRQYRALELSLRSSERSSMPALVSYTYARVRGNYTGLYATDADLPGAHTGPQFDYVEELVNGDGPLPNDRPHQLRALAARRLGQRVSLGATLVWASGTPLSELGVLPVDPSYHAFLSLRGAAGRTPAIWDLNLRLVCDLVNRGAMRTSLVVDARHVGNPRRPVEMDQVRYLAVDSLGTPVNPNTNYGKPVAWQPPQSLRVGIRANF